MTVFEGALSGAGLRFGIVVSRFNDVVSERLLSGARDAFRRHAVPDEAVDVVRVPGSFEIPVTVKRLACSGSYDALVCLGAVIRGDTAHFEYVAGHAASGIARVALETGIPIIFGVVTTENLEQAIERAGGKAGNKGYEAALSAIEMANVLKQLPAG